MHLDGYLILGAAVVGLLVGMTGAGGGALMTPMLIVLFGVKPIAAISSDLVASVVMRPLGAGVHARARTINFGLVKWLALGSVPAAFAGTYLLHVIGNGPHATKEVKFFLGLALLTGAAAMAVRYMLDRRSGERREGQVRDLKVRPSVTVVIGVVGGLVVGLTSVGSGSLMIVLLLFAYPVIGARQLVGTDLAQAVPLTLAAAAGALLWGHVEFGITGSLIIGSIPGVIAGSLLSSTVPDRYVRPVIGLVICASGMKYVGVGNVTLLWISGLLALILISFWLFGSLAHKGRAPAAIESEREPSVTERERAAVEA